MGLSGSSAFQTRIVQSSETEAMRRPSGLNATPKIMPVCPLSTMGCPEPSAFHSRTVESTEAEAMRRPSGLKAMPRI
jgi:hypothetical protein